MTRVSQADRAQRSRAELRREVGRLQAEARFLQAEFERACASAALGDLDTEVIEEVEREVAQVDRDLRRARAASTYLS